MSEPRNSLWAAYVKAVAGDVPAQAIVDRIAERFDGQGVSQPTVSRWIVGRHSAEIKPGNVAAFAAAYERPILQAFVAARMLTPDQARVGLDEEELAFVMNLESVEISGSRPRASRAPRKP